MIQTSKEYKDIKEFVEWFAALDPEYVLGSWDYAIGWFSARGHDFCRSLAMAESVKKGIGR